MDHQKMIMWLRCFVMVQKDPLEAADEEILIP